MSDPHFAIAIDGPAASGKSTIARELANRLGLNFVNSGAMYRALAWAAVQQAVDTTDADAVRALLMRVKIDCGMANARSTVLIDGVNPGLELVSPEVNAHVSNVAAVPEVRAQLVAKQRDYLQLGSLVMEGRDIGSVVFPDTAYKLYIDASEEVRASRRAAEGTADAVALRDKADSQRKASPLIIAEGAIVIDSSDMDVEQTVSAAIEALRKQGLQT